jgi:hypothetical protein
VEKSPEQIQAQYEKALQYRKEWYVKNHARQRFKQLLHLHKITSEDYFRLFADGKCNICGTALAVPGLDDYWERLIRKEVTGQAVLDHDHATAQPRGILCRRCNRLLGYLENYPDLIEPAMRYLGKQSIDSGESEKKP